MGSKDKTPSTGTETETDTGTDAKLIGEAIKLLRTRRRRKAFELCDATGITKGMLSSYETGRKLPATSTLLSVLRGLEMDLCDLQKAMDFLQGKSEQLAVREERKETAKEREEQELGAAVRVVMKHFLAGLHPLLQAQVAGEGTGTGKAGAL